MLPWQMGDMRPSELNAIWDVIEAERKAREKEEREAKRERRRRGPRGPAVS